MNEKKLEKAVLSVLMIHHIFMFIGAIYYGYPSWISAVILLTGICSVFLVAGNAWKHSVRAAFITVMAYISITLYGTHTASMYDFIVPFIGITIIVAFLGMAKLLVVPAISFTYLVFFQRFVLENFTIRTIDDFYAHFVPIFNVYFIIAILYFWNVKRTEVAEKMREMVINLQSAEHGKDDFIANVSHEIRTPINNILGMSEVVLRDELPADVKENVAGIQTSGKQLSAIVSDIIDFSEFQTGKMSIVESKYNIDLLIRETISVSKAIKGEKNIQLLYECDGNMPLYLIGDMQKLSRILYNLIDNAIKFTNEGCVVIKVGSRKEEYGINLSITVSDTGIGMDADNIEKLYTSYNQVDTKRNRQTGGIGLGLAITKAIVELMGGVISVYSEKERGTEVRVVIPQKVVDEKQLVVPFLRDTVSMLSYLSEDVFESIQTRDAYIRVFESIARGMNITYALCHSTAELVRRCEKETPTYILVGWMEYYANMELIDELSELSKVIVLLEENQVKYIRNDRIIPLAAPVYIGAFADAINPDSSKNKNTFTAPDARLLIVDDNAVNLKVISGLLEPYKMNIQTASSGPEALEMLETNRYDLIFMDHMMPEMDGVETLKHIRNKNGLYYREVPVIAVTANAVPGAREMFINEGFQDYVAKPVEAFALDRILVQYISDKFVYSDELENEIHEAYKDVQNADLGDLNVKVGIEFCGSYENLLDILKIHCDEGMENYNKIEDFYQKKDWKNYAINVHGLKSSMKSVGADRLSEMAKGLEFASKECDENYITENHPVMMQEYRRILEILYNYFGVQNDTESEENLSGLTEIEEAELSEFIAGFENAAYSWDDMKLRSLSGIIENRYYKGVSIVPLYEKVCNKIEMTDYLSALDLIKSWKAKNDREA